MHSNENTYHCRATQKGTTHTKVPKNHLWNDFRPGKKVALIYSSTQPCYSILWLQIKCDDWKRWEKSTKASNIFRIISFSIKKKKTGNQEKQTYQQLRDYFPFHIPENPGQPSLQPQKHCSHTGSPHRPLLTQDALVCRCQALQTGAQILPQLWAAPVTLDKLLLLGPSARGTILSVMLCR